MKYYVVLKSEEEISEFVQLNSLNSVIEDAMSTLLDCSSNKNIFVEIVDGISFQMCSPDRHIPHLVVTLKQYLTLQAKKPAQDRITAEESVKVLREEYYTGKYIEIFGRDYAFDDLMKNFTPAEIVSKIADWKDKQAAKVKVNEDMIADALDEKFGVGKWTREEN